MVEDGQKHQGLAKSSDVTEECRLSKAPISVTTHTNIVFYGLENITIDYLLCVNQEVSWWCKFIRAFLHFRTYQYLSDFCEINKS